MNNLCKKRLASWAMLAVMMLQLALPVGAAQEQNLIHISCIKDWAEFADQCRLDTWSQDKVVVLDCDLDLMGVEAVPTFGGTFDGCGHTVSGFERNAGQDRTGLFRYIQPGGTVKNLNVSGAEASGGTAKTAGGLVGVNSGVVDSCSFHGTLSGSASVGGIAGFNGETGQILHCTNLGGVITGEHSTGGIVGVNYGTVLACSNSAQINTQELGVTPELDGVDWEKLNSTENMPARTDTGGIAGFSSGIIKNCSNTGTVGYPHTGYNVGGIAGRQSGFLTGCSNSAAVRGRKEVGGIVGQMEPYTLLKYKEDTLQKLSRELEKLSTLMGEALDRTDVTRGKLSDHITAITGRTDDARGDVKKLLDQVEELGDGTVSTVNELSRRIKRAIDQLAPVSDGMEDASRKIHRALDALEKAVNASGSSSQSVKDAVSHMKSALQNVDDAIRTLMTGVPVPLTPEAGAVGHLGEIAENTKRVFELLSAMLDYLPQSREELEDAFEELKNAGSSMGELKPQFDETIRELEKSIRELGHSSDYVTQALQDLHDMIQEQSELPELEFPTLSDGFHAREDSLDETLSALTNELEQMNQTADRGGEELSGALSKVNNQFQAVVRVLRTAREDSDKDEERVVDISEEDIANTTQGKVSGCRNEGTVEGDVNVGGVNGAMAIEYDFDPEDDIKNQGDPSVKFQFLTRVILQDCVNLGQVSARKDCAGGCTGRMDLGVAVGCENYGRVESTGGEYVGGTAGVSYGVIRSCWSKCELSGSRLVGGVAGWGCDIRDCRTLVRIEDSVPCSGAIAGEMDVDAVLVGNTFVENGLGGVDGISYAGKAEPVSYKEFAASENIPDGFGRMQITFLVGDRAIAVREVSFGGLLRDEDVPQVPEREGYHGQWSDFQHKRITFDQQVHAVYTPWMTTAASQDGMILAEGSFPYDVYLNKYADEHQPPEGEVYGQWLLETNDRDPIRAVRVACPEKGSFRLWQFTQEEGWTQLDSKRTGSYLRAETEGESIILCMTKAPVSGERIAVYALAGAAAVLLIVFTAKKVRKSRAQKRKIKEE